MYYLKCKRIDRDGYYYIWANQEKLNEWCISITPCYFQDYETAHMLYELVFSQRGVLRKPEILNKKYK